MRPTPDSHSARPARAPERSPRARGVAEWLRHLGQAAHLARLHGRSDPRVAPARQQALEYLEQLLGWHGTLTLRFTATDVSLADEPLGLATARDEEARTLATAAASLFFRDGIRGLTLHETAERAELELLLEATLTVAEERLTDDDLVTLLSYGTAAGVQLEVAPLEPAVEARGTADFGPELLPAPAALLAHHLDTFDDWVRAEPAPDLMAAWTRLDRDAATACATFRDAWTLERATPWASRVPALFTEVLALDPTDDTREALTRAAVTWVAGAMQGGEWLEALAAFDQLCVLDPEGRWWRDELGGAVTALDAEAIAERLDESAPESAARFFALMVTVGRPALDLTCAVLGRSARPRVRAAACTALCYACSDRPDLLGPWLRDPRWHVVRNIVFVLGQIGGPVAGRMISATGGHPDVRVRRQVVQSLGSVPEHERVPALLSQLATDDAQLLGATLSMLSRERSTRIANALIQLIEAPDFEARSDEHKRALFATLGDVADDHAIPALEQMLNRGGWFARRTTERTAAARTLARIGSLRAMHELETGQHSRAEAVRAACVEAMQHRGPA